jgi:hypothetical protein
MARTFGAKNYHEKMSPTRTREIFVNAKYLLQKIDKIWPKNLSVVDAE